MPDSDRMVCSKCGANNFSTQAACWKCGAVLGVGTTTPAARVASQPLHFAVPQPHLDGAAIPVPVDPAIAIWTGIILAILLPTLAIPVGMVFLMLDDRRRIEVGRITLLCGIVSFMVQFICSVYAVKNLVTEARSFLPTGAHGGAAAPAPNDPVAPQSLPPEFRP